MKRGNLAAITTAVMTVLLASGARAHVTDFASSAQAVYASETLDTTGSIFVPPLPVTVQEDLGDIRPANNAPWTSYFSGQTQVNTEYTSNATLYHSRDNADFLISPMAEETFAAPINKNFRVDITARVEDYTYASHQNLGFWGFSGSGYLEYRYKPSAPRFYVGVEPYYYFAYSNGGRLTSAVAPVAGVDHSISIDRGKTLVYMGYHFGDYFSTPNIDTRQSHTVDISVTQQLRRDLYAQLYWEGQYSRYTSASRDEMRDIIGANLIHQFNPREYVSLFVNYIDNASNNSLAKYTTVNAGVSFVCQY
jgi:hypothetical protein